MCGALHKKITSLKLPSFISSHLSIDFLCSNFFTANFSYFYFLSVIIIIKLKSFSLSYPIGTSAQREKYYNIFSRFMVIKKDKKNRLEPKKRTMKGTRGRWNYGGDVVAIARTITTQNWIHHCNTLTFSAIHLFPHSCQTSELTISVFFLFVATLPPLIFYSHKKT